MRGVALHIGSQLLNLEPLETAFGKIGKLITDLRAQGIASPMPISAAGWESATAGRRQSCHIPMNMAKWLRARPRAGMSS
jgi:diaminopimelate decarboxylase